MLHVTVLYVHQTQATYSTEFKTFYEVMIRYNQAPNFGGRSSHYSMTMIHVINDDDDN